MRTKLTAAFVITIIAIFLIGFCTPPSNAAEKSRTGVVMTQYVHPVVMTCKSCVNRGPLVHPVTQCRKAKCGTMVNPYWLHR